jgi:hypothetical protein
MRSIDVFYQLRYFLSLNTRNACIRDGGSSFFFFRSKKVFPVALMCRSRGASC